MFLIHQTIYEIEFENAMLILHFFVDYSKFFLNLDFLKKHIIDYQLKLVSLYIEQRDFLNAEELLSNLQELNPERKEVYLNQVIIEHMWNI